MPQPTAGDLHVNTPLTNISIAYIQAATAFVASRIFPVVPVSKQADRYYKYTMADWNRQQAQRRAPGTESAGSGWTVDNTPTYFADIYAVHKDIDDPTRANADAVINLDRDATQWTTQQLLLRREALVVGSYFKAGVWGTDLTGAAATPGAGEFLQWDKADSDPIKDVTGAVIAVAKKTGVRPNKLVIGPEVLAALKNNAKILDRIKYTQRGQVTTDILAGLFEVDEVLVPWSVQDSAAEGAASSMDFIWGKSALLVYSAPAPSLMQPSAGYIFAWTGYLGAGADGNRIKRFRMEQLSSDRIEGEMAIDPKLVCAELGVFLSGAVA